MEKLNKRFVQFADWVSYAIGTPVNIGFWVLAVVIWFVLGPWLGSGKPGFALPGWFTSTAWNFPLNTVTTLAELYIGFLLAAAANRAQRKLEEILGQIHDAVSMLVKLTKQQDKVLKALVSYQKVEVKEIEEVKVSVKDTKGGKPWPRS